MPSAARPRTINPSLAYRFITFPFTAGVPYRLLSLSNVTNPCYRTPHVLWRLNSSGSFATFTVHEPRVLFLVFVILIAVI